MEQPQGSEVFEQPEVIDIVLGTLPTQFDMCEVGKLKVPKGNNYLRKRTTVRTTSRELHECLDSRYCKHRHKHQPIEGKIRYLGRWINLSEYAARYSNGFAKNVAWYFCHSLKSWESPLELTELCIQENIDPKSDSLALAATVKARRCKENRKDVKGAAPVQKKEPHDPLHKTPRYKRLVEIFTRVDKKAPRAGTVVLDTKEELFQEVRSVCSSVDVRSR